MNCVCIYAVAFVFTVRKLVVSLLPYAKLRFIFAGPEKEFYSFYDRCFESKQNKLQILS